MSMMVFWAVTPCGRLGRYQHFGGTYCLNLQPLSPHYITTQKTNIDTFTAVRTSNLFVKLNVSISRNSIKTLIFVMETRPVFFEVRTELLNTI
jgi:hypothetical protein